MTDAEGRALRAAVEAFPGATIHDLFCEGEFAAVRWSRIDVTGLSMLRIPGDVTVVQSWTGTRQTGAGPWPDPEPPGDAVALAKQHAGKDPAPGRATLARYFEIRADQSRASELRSMFAEPMVVHGPGPTRVEDLDQFIERVRRETEGENPLRFRPDHSICSGDRALLRWTYFAGDTLAAAGLTMYAFQVGVIVNRWQASLPDLLAWL